MLEALEEVCKHHWVIESPNGKPVLIGACKLCLESKTFPAWPETLEGIWVKPDKSSNKAISVLPRTRKRDG